MTRREMAAFDREVLSVDFSDALPLIEAKFPDHDPVEIYWQIAEAAEMAAEIADFD